jgi:hypothetical protein
MNPPEAEQWLADAVSAMASRMGLRRIGLVASEKTYAQGTLRRLLAARGIVSVPPSLAERRELLHATTLLEAREGETARFHLLAVAHALAAREGLGLVVFASPLYEAAIEECADGPLPIVCGVRLVNDAVAQEWGLRDCA